MRLNEKEFRSSIKFLRNSSSYQSYLEGRGPQSATKKFLNILPCEKSFAADWSAAGNPPFIYNRNVTWSTRNNRKVDERVQLQRKIRTSSFVVMLTDTKYVWYPTKPRRDHKDKKQTIASINEAGVCLIVSTNPFVWDPVFESKLIHINRQSDQIDYR